MDSRAYDIKVINSQNVDKIYEMSELKKNLCLTKKLNQIGEIKGRLLVLIKKKKYLQ